MSWKERYVAAAAEASHVQRWSKHSRVDGDDQTCELRHNGASHQDVQKDASSSDALLADWVIVEDPGPEELRLVPFMTNNDDSQGLSKVATTVALSGAAGLLFIGPMAGAVIAAGTAGAYAEPGRLSAVAGHAIRWVQRCSPKSVAECGQACEVLAERAKDMVGEVRKLPDKLNPSLASVYSTLSGSALAERDVHIKRLQAALEASTRDSAEERTRSEELRDVQEHWRSQSARLASELQDAEQASAIQQQRFHRDMENTRHAKDEEVGRLAKELEATERVWEQDTARLTRELEHHRCERLAENRRLTSELADAARAKDAELSNFEEALAALAEARREQASETEARRQSETALEEVRRQGEEQGELRRCCICLDAERHVLFLPCRHVCCCRDCAASLESCPIDRARVVQKIDFIMS